MKSCSSCKYWLPPSERNDFTNVVRFEGEEWDVANDAYPRADKDDKLFGLCRLIDLGVALSLDRPTPLAVTRDGSEYKARLYTQAEFGCALWEKQEEVPQSDAALPPSG